ncbi:HIRAN domain-containing protein [Actinoplanes sp. NPDC023936]|uniref:HIRAN domain-containing protein n=1 Tax=Actinoplanes sp. NPDC023936 TaxID=3154910 RepID=UPI0033D6E184
MGLIDRILGRPNAVPDNEPSQQAAAEPAEPPQSSYVPKDDPNRFIHPSGRPPLHLVPYRDMMREDVLRLCEDSTGLLVSPSDQRLPKIGIFVSQLRGEAYHQDACRTGDFRPGSTVVLRREPDNEYDKNAVAVYDHTGRHLAAYVNKQKARMLAKLLDSGQPITAISLRGTGPGVPCEQVAVLAGAPDVVAQLLEPRPNHLPPPVQPR